MQDEIKKHPEIFQISEEGMVSLTDDAWKDPDVQEAMRRLREESVFTSIIVTHDEMPAKVARLTKHGIDVAVVCLYDEDGALLDTIQIDAICTQEVYDAAIGDA